MGTEPRAASHKWEGGDEPGAHSWHSGGDAIPEAEINIDGLMLKLKKLGQSPHQSTEENEKLRQRGIFEVWYGKRFPSSSLDSAHAFGAWYGWQAALSQNQ